MICVVEGGDCHCFSMHFIIRTSDRLDKAFLLLFYFQISGLKKQTNKKNISSRMLGVFPGYRFTKTCYSQLAEGKLSCGKGEWHPGVPRVNKGRPTLLT